MEDLDVTVHQRLHSKNHAYIPQYSQKQKVFQATWKTLQICDYPLKMSVMIQEFHDQSEE